MKTRFSMAAALVVSSLALQASADQVVSENLIVQGKFCSGFDCEDGEAFGEETILFKDNNLRLTFIDTTADPAAQSWRLVVNETVDDGLDYFQVQVQPDLSGTDDGARALHFGVADNGSIALGSESEIVDDTVTVGQADLERRIRHVAQALADTDLATGSTVNSHFDALHADLDAIDAELDEIEVAVELAEAGPDTPPGAPPGGSSGGGSPGPLSLLGILGCIAMVRRLHQNTR